MLVRHLVAGILPQPLAPLDVGMDGAALDRPRPHQRHLHRQVVQVLRQRPRQHLHLRPALDLEHAGGLRPLDRTRQACSSSSGTRERSIRSSRVLAISSTHRSTAESIPSPSRSIFRNPASAHESLSHCTICRPSIAAGCTGQSSISDVVEITIPPGCCDMCRGSPAICGKSSASARHRSSAPATGPGSPPSAPTRPGSPHRRRPPARTARPRPGAAPAPCRGRGPHRARGRWGRRRPAPTGRRRSARAPAGSASRGCREGSRGRCRGPRSAPRSGSGPRKRSFFTGSTCESPVR